MSNVGVPPRVIYQTVGPMLPPGPVDGQVHLLISLPTAFRPTPGPARYLRYNAVERRWDPLGDVPAGYSSTVIDPMDTAVPSPVGQVIPSPSPVMVIGPTGPMGPTGPAGPSGTGGSSTSPDPDQDLDLSLVTNLELTQALSAGMPVHAPQPNVVRAAVGNDRQRRNVIGLLAQNLAPGGQGRLQTGGLLTCPVAVWEALTGMVGGLVSNRAYYLHPTLPGQLSYTPPEPVPGQEIWSVQLGVALSPTQLKIEIQRSVKL